MGLDRLSARAEGREFDPQAKAVAVPVPSHLKVTSVPSSVPTSCPRAVLRGKVARYGVECVELKRSASKGLPFLAE